jgi:hypothetical protein
MKTDFTLKTRSAAQIAAANKAAAPANAKPGRSKTLSEETTMTKERKVIGNDHHNNPVHEGREVVGKDDYGRDVFDGQVEIKDAHGNTVHQEPWVGKGPKAGPDNIEGKDLEDEDEE